MFSRQLLGNFQRTLPLSFTLSPRYMYVFQYLRQHHLPSFLDTCSSSLGRKAKETRSANMFSLSLSSANVSGGMECGVAASLHALEKLGEILHWKENQNPSSELEICSSSKKYLPAFRNLQNTASSSKHADNAGLRLVSEISGRDGMKHEDRAMHRSMKVKQGSTTSIKGKQVLRATEVEQLGERLRALEEEAESMKQEFMEHVEESKRMMSEIYQQFQMIHRCIRLQDEEPQHL